MKKAIQNIQILGLVMVLSGCATDEITPISMSKHPLALQVDRASLTHDVQSFRTGEYTMPDFDLRKATGNGYTYTGQMEPVYKLLSPKESWAFLIVDFKISGVSGNLGLSMNDVQLLDGKGVGYPAVGISVDGNYKWMRADSIGISHESTEKWIFTIPDASVTGAVLKFQKNTYPLPIAN